ncbi:MAG: GGDEF domain-containing protein [Syntrophobacteraceae bacterium]
MERFMGKLARSVANMANVVYGIARRFDYERLSCYMLNINQMHDLKGIVCQTSECIADILNCRLFGFAIQFGESLEAWVAPSSYELALRNIVEKDFRIPEGFQIHHLDDDTDKPDQSIAFNSESLDSYVVTGDSYFATLYILPGRRPLTHHRHVMVTILKTLSVAISNFMNIRRLESQAAFDQLTDCYNRHEFNRLIEHSIGSARRYGRDLSIILLDLDHFKNVNDTYGHQMGDMVLRDVAGRLKSAVRKGDYVARYGGEEFFVVLPDTNLANAVELAERLRSIIEEQDIKFSDGFGVSVSASFGVASLADHFEKNELIAAADGMLYRAKSAGRNRVMPRGKLHLVEKESPNVFMREVQ